MARRRHIEDWRLWMRDLARRQARIDDEYFRAVVQARLEGDSWPEIARFLGVSTQAAHKRYAARVNEWIAGHPEDGSDG